MSQHVVHDDSIQILDVSLDEVGVERWLGGE